MWSKLLFLFNGIAIGAAVMFSLMANRTVEVQADCQNELCVNPPCCNGDLNGDRVIDISDAVYLLSYLFAGGPEPQYVSNGLLSTGQMICYDNDKEIPCENSVFPGQDGFYQLGCTIEGRFVDNRDGTVTDNCTNLMWQKNTADINEDSNIDYENDPLVWQEALQYCNNIELAGYTDWRLPNIQELLSLIDYRNSYPAIHSLFRSEDSRYWSSTTHNLFSSAAWFVSFGLGNGDSMFKINKNYVRAVRTIQPGE